MYKKLDKTGDDTLDLKEFSVLVKTIDKNVEDYIITFVYEKMDKDKNGTINFDEFKSLFLENDYSNDFEMHPILMQYNAIKYLKKMKLFIKAYKIQLK